MNKEWHEQYFKLRFPLESKNIKMEDSERLKIKNLPLKIYQYRSLSKPVADSFVEDKVRVTRMSKLNDPFEAVAAVLASFAGQDLASRRHDIEIFRNNLFVSCFTEKMDCPLMWGHYADKHKGICVEYSKPMIEGEEALIEDIFPAHYKQERLTFGSVERDLISNGVFNYDVGVHSCLIKSTHWAYENEWRYFSQDENYNNPKDPDGYQVKFIKPSAVYFGVRASEDSDDVIRIKDYCNLHGIAIYNMHIHNEVFELFPESMK